MLLALAPAVTSVSHLPRLVYFVWDGMSIGNKFTMLKNLLSGHGTMCGMKKPLPSAYKEVKGMLGKRILFVRRTGILTVMNTATRMKLDDAKHFVKIEKASNLALINIG